MSLRKKVISAMICGSIAAFTLVPASKAVNSDIVLASETYIVSNSITRYSNAEDASTGNNPVGTYNSGTYYIYKRAQGMINITTNPGMPGSWVNPSEDGSVGSETEEAEKETESESTVTTVTESTTTTTAAAKEETLTTAAPEKEEVPQSGTFVLSSSSKVYPTADSAASGRRSSVTYPAGTYYIYKSYNGMLNISRNPGQAGGWINPGEGYESIPETTTSTKPSATTKPESTSTTAKAPVTTVSSDSSQTSGDYVLTAAAPKYINAANAAAKTGSLGNMEAGKYYIYKTSNGMINITKNQGVPGAWINPGTTAPSKPSEPTTTTVSKTTTTTTTTKATTTTTTKATTPSGTAPVVGGTIKLASETMKYTNADDAASKTNSVGTYPAGTYYIYKMSGGMINVTRTPGLAGAWINSADGSGAQAPKPGTSPTESKKRESIADYAMQFVGDGGSKFQSWYGLYDEWCAMFVAYNAAKTGNEDLIPKIAYVPTYVDMFRKQNNLTVDKSYRPEKDMLIVFDYEPNGISNHIGIVTGSDKNYVYTVEGNASDSVMAKKYDIDDPNIMGYMLPGYKPTTVAGQLLSTGAYIKRLTR